MLRWKNIPINELSQDQLRRALIESVDLNMNAAEVTHTGSAFPAYLAGLLSGGIISGAGILLASIL